ncbi:MFS transporter [Phycicoccus sp. CSK15P-2]|uniref:MFS transporter n=1 Tax=Phycicoccus sp. CSK15P-2 TaxID=2807627 RepID=UPI00195138EE|nr:MFS transporter [Phycicoccus sp. CSK15P-2]MBM6406122.1 MFS transporter [Phycicoccus sp. CSK15P-2]
MSAPDARTDRQRAPRSSRSGRFATSAKAVARGGSAGVRAVGRGGRAVGRGGRAVGRRFRSFAAADGAADTGLARLTELHAVNVAGDAAVTVSLAGTVFAMPTDEARGRVALFLLLTMAPFVVLAPLIGPLLDRFRHGRRWALGTTLAVRGFLAWVLATAVVEESAWLFPAALGCLVGSRSYAVARAAAVPRLLPADITLVTANSRLNIAGIIGMALGGGIAGAASGVGPEWSLRVAFVVFVVATVLSIRLPARVDSSVGEVDVDGTPVHREPIDEPERGARRMRALPVPVRYVLWLTTGARMLSGFLTLFLMFLMREAPLNGWSGPFVLGVVIGAAGVGNAVGSLVGNRKHTPDPALMATVVAAVAVVATVLAAALYSLWALVLLGLAAGVYGQLGKLCLDALVQRDVPDRTRARVFSWSETILQAFWVVGGSIGILVPLEPTLGFTVVTVVVLAAGLLAVRSRHTARTPATDPVPDPRPPTTSGAPSDAS